MAKKLVKGLDLGQQILGDVSYILYFPDFPGFLNNLGIA